MSHGITRTDQMMYAQENGAPWHNLGIGVEEAPTSQEAMELANLGWDIGFRPVYINAGGRQVKVKDYRAVIRSDTQEPLGVVGDRYQAIQNSEMFAFMDELVGTGELKYETAGSLWGGRRVWMLARVPQEISLGGDKVFPYLLLSSSHDGSALCRVQPTLVRVVCNNTLQAAVFTSDEEVRQLTVGIRHTGDIRNKLGTAREVLGLSLKVFGRFETVANELRAKDGMPLVGPFLDQLFPARANLAEGQEDKRRDAKIEAFQEVLAEENTRSGEHTAYDVLNALGGYADHVHSVGGARDSKHRTKEESRLSSVFFYGGNDLKRRGMELLFEMTDIYANLDADKVPVVARS